MTAARLALAAALLGGCGAPQRAARRIERVAEVVFVSLVAIGFLIWALRMSGT